MSFLDKARAMADKAKEQAAQLASQHGDKIDQAIDKGGSLVDQKTHGKYADKVVKARAAAKQAADRLAAQANGPAPGPHDVPPPGGTPPAWGTTPPPPPPGAATGTTPPPPPPGAATGTTPPPPSWDDPTDSRDRPGS